MSPSLISLPIVPPRPPPCIAWCHDLCYIYMHALFVVVVEYGLTRQSAFMIRGVNATTTHQRHWLIDYRKARTDMQAHSSTRMALNGA
jgi:hypothetical protein